MKKRNYNRARPSADIMKIEKVMLLVLGICTVIAIPLGTSLKSRVIRAQQDLQQRKELQFRLDSVQQKLDHTSTQVESSGDTIKRLEDEKKDLEQKLQSKKDAAAKLALVQKAQAAAEVATPAPKAASVPSGSVQEIIVKWANHYGVDANMLLRIAKCESTYNPMASNGTHFGIFQFAPATYNANAARLGLPPGEWYNPDRAAQVAAWMFSIGQAWQWECK